MFKVYVVFLVICTGYLSVKYFSVCLGHFECVCVYGHAHLWKDVFSLYTQ